MTADARQVLAQIQQELEEATRHTHICGSCDAGLPMNCTCPAKDYHQVISELVDVVRRQNAALTAVLDLHGPDGCLHPISSLMTKGGCPTVCAITAALVDQ